MTTSEVLAKVRRIEIKTVGISNHVFSGEYHSAFKGRGMSFSEVREYAPGDDVRTIDWNVTARFSTPYVKVFEEERELTLMLLVDISKSSLFGSVVQNKRDIITEICGVLSFAAINNNDKVGVIFFSDKIEKYIPPKKGKSHVLRIIRELITIQPAANTKTDIQVCLEYFNRIIKKKAITLLVSDFISPDFSTPLKIAARKHDLIGMQVFDPMDRVLPDVGVIQIQDIETGGMQWIDASNKATRQQYTQQFDIHKNGIHQLFKKNGAHLISMDTQQDYVKKLQTFFVSR